MTQSNAKINFKEDSLEKNQSEKVSALVYHTSPNGFFPLQGRQIQFTTALKKGGKG